MSDDTPSLIEGLVPGDDEVRYSIGRYQVLADIGKGGMGEVVVAYDTVCGRRIALKKIRADLLEHKQIHSRFLKEARITCQLTHPAIIPIYVIENEKNVVYYTMPFVKGETLKQILRRTRAQEKEGEPQDHLGSSIPALVRIFIAICQAVAYAHAQGVLHRDLKPENIMIGSYGEAYILDWGLAEMIEGKEELLQADQWKHQMTRIGKIVGTISYMAPERGLGQPATIQTDIYSLGVILFQILTLKNPFRRGSLKEFRKQIEKEEIPDPQEMAPYRDIPPILSRIAVKCLARSASERYKTVDQLIHDLENYIEGRSEWFPIAELDVENTSDWEFQEHVLIAEHVAITQATELSDWVNLMISKISFSENTRIDVIVRIEEGGCGIGFLLSIPEPAERQHINDGFCLWIGSDSNRSTKLFKSTVEVVSAKEVFLKEGEWTKIAIEKMGNNLYFFLNDVLQFSYISHLPLTGTHVGVMSRDSNYEIEDLTVSVASTNLTVNCLAVPDSLLAHKLWSAALAEYRRIGYSFPGRQEGRDAMFRAGITLLEQAKGAKEPHAKENFFEMALEEFEKLHATPGAPLEYLGKSLVYGSMGEDEEEYKCLELAFRRYRHHPLLEVLKEHITFRLHECARVNRKATYQLALIILRHTPELTNTPHVQKLFIYLKKHWEPLPFLVKPEFDHPLYFAVRLAFWLAKPFILLEILQELQENHPLYNEILFCLIELGAWKLAEEKITQSSPLWIPFCSHKESVGTAYLFFLQGLAPEKTFDDERNALHLMQNAIDFNEPLVALEIAEHFPGQEEIGLMRIWALLMARKTASAAMLLQRYTLSAVTEDNSLLFTLYGCYLAATEGKEIAEAHFSGLLDTPYPKSPVLLGHFLNGKLTAEWQKRAFLVEKKQLWRQLALFYACLGNPVQELFYLDLVRQQTCQV